MYNFPKKEKKINKIKTLTPFEEFLWQDLCLTPFLKALLMNFGKM